MSDVLTELEQRVAALVETNARLNRRCQALEKTVTTQSEKGAWYRYFKAACDIYGQKDQKVQVLKRKVADLRREVLEEAAEVCDGLHMFVVETSDSDGRPILATPEDCAKTLREMARDAAR